MLTEKERPTAITKTTTKQKRKQVRLSRLKLYNIRNIQRKVTVLQLECARKCGKCGKWGIITLHGLILVKYTDSTWWPYYDLRGWGVLYKYQLRLIRHTKQHVPTAPYLVFPLRLSKAPLSWQRTNLHLWFALIFKLTLSIPSRKRILKILHPTEQ